MYFALFAAKECDQEAREPHVLEVDILGNRLQELSGQRNDQDIYHCVQAFVEKYRFSDMAAWDK